MTDMDLGWNEPAPATKDELIGVLKDVIAHLEADDSMEGFIQYEIPIGSPEDERRAERDPRWAQADFGLMARYRIGNSMGQGGLRSFTKPRDP